MKKNRIFRLSVLMMISALIFGLCSCVSNTTLVIGGGDDTNATKDSAPEANGHGSFRYEPVGDKYEIVGYDENSTTVAAIEIPASIDGIDVVSIAADAFAACTYISSITIPSTVTSIGDFAFRECTYLESIVIPDTVQSIGIGLFSKCVSLTSVTLPAGLTAIPDHTFSGCTALTSFPISETITEIGAGAFRDCSALTSVTIPETVQKIGAQAYYNCASLTYFEMNAKLQFVTTLDEEGNVVVDDALSTIGEYMLYRFSTEMDPETGIVFDKDKTTGNLGMQAYYVYYNLDIEPAPLESETTKSASVVG